MVGLVGYYDPIGVLSGRKTSRSQDRNFPFVNWSLELFCFLGAIVQRNNSKKVVVALGPTCDAHYCSKCNTWPGKQLATLCKAKCLGNIHVSNASGKTVGHFIHAKILGEISCLMLSIAWKLLTCLMLDMNCGVSIHTISHHADRIELIRALQKVRSAKDKPFYYQSGY